MQSNSKCSYYKTYGICRYLHEYFTKGKLNKRKPKIENINIIDKLYTDSFLNCTQPKEIAESIAKLAAWKPFNPSIIFTAFTIPTIANTVNPVA